MEKISNIITKKNYFSQYQGSLVCHVAKKTIKKLTNEEAKIISTKNKVLKLKIANNYAATEIRLKKIQILDDINKKIGRTAVENIRFIQ